MAVKVREIVRWMESWAAPAWADPDDRIGLQIGAMDAEVNRVAVALDVTEAVVDEAVRRGANLIIAHHPIIYRPLAAIRTDQPAGRLIRKLIAADIAVFAAHTNLDSAPGGVNDLLADRLGLAERRPLMTVCEEPVYKLAVYVPASHLDAVRNAVFSAGAGHIGKYSHCGFTVPGEGTFLPGEGANPFSGEPGRLAREEELRFETIVPGAVKDEVLRAMLAAHPYEEVAFDLFRLEMSGAKIGLGRIGTLPEDTDLAAFAGKVKEAFGVPALRCVGDPQRPVRRVAVLGGSGRSFMKHAIAAGADVYVTGDIDHHTAHDALAAGLAIVDPGHHIEGVMKAAVADRLAAQASAAGWDIDVYASPISTEPFQFL